MNPPDEPGARHTVTLPKLGDTVSEVYVLEWLVEVGDLVEPETALMTVETDKVDAEVPSPVAGRVVERLVEADAEIETGTPLCIIET
jgi:pyruvate/2-oxoglutarate dehydrogenase complex dihydrolipoamide acyltransferase (E2) component